MREVAGLSERQLFRMGILEGITIPVMVAPYVAVNASKDAHLLVILVGIMLVFAYGMLMYYLQRGIDGGAMNSVNSCGGVRGFFIKSTYCLRFLLKSAIIILFFTRVIKKYLLYNTNEIFITSVFVAVCVFGASGSINKRGRLLELLYLWVVLPLILTVVFSISNVQIGDVTENSKGSIAKVFKDFDLNNAGIISGAILILVLASAIELMFFYHGYVKDNSLHVALKINIWIGITIILGYVIVVGILGSSWAANDSLASFSVMEATKLPGDAVNRLDYLIISFWVIGVFAVVSGFVFVSRNMISSMSKAPSAITAVLLVVCVLFVKYEDVTPKRYVILVFADLFLSVLLPLLLRVQRVKIKSASTLALLIVTACFLSGCKGNYESMSIENRDYVVDMKITPEEDLFRFEFSVANLTKYSAEGGIDTAIDDYVYYSESVEGLTKMYFEDNEKQLDLGHISTIYFDGEMTDFDLLIMEISDATYISKSIEAKTRDGKENLRDLIKACYARQ